jgi:hypothetical protein
VRIACFAPTDDGVVGDVETGDMLPWEAPSWVVRRRQHGVDPTVYVNLSNWAPTRTEFQLRRIPEPHYWLALYDDIPVLPSGAVAKQFANAAFSGGHFDLSVVADYWPGVDPEGGFFMDQDVRNTFKKLHAAQAARALGIRLSDAELDQVWPQIHDDFSNVQAVLTALEHSKTA